jgi:hypothetical protein
LRSLSFSFIRASSSASRHVTRAAYSGHKTRPTCEALRARWEAYLRKAANRELQLEEQVFNGS